METGLESTLPTGSDEPGQPLKIVASDDVRAFVQERGGRLYVWTTDHRCCHGALTLLEADTKKPERWNPYSEWIVADGFEVYFDGGWHTRPDELVLELNWRRRKVRAYWNGCAYIV